MMNSGAARQPRGSARKKKKKKLKKNRHQHNPVRDYQREGSIWDQEFIPEPFRIWQIENRPYMEVWEENNSDISRAAFFMIESGAANRVMPQVELVAAFCPDIVLEELKSGCLNATSTPVSLLDDRTNDGVCALPRDYLGPLTAHQLYVELAKKRFHCNDDFPQRSRSQQTAQSPQRNADRRLIFITDLNRWALMAIISTASINQARALRDSLYRHLAFESFIGAVPPPNGYATFQLAFDLPFFVLRTAPRHRPPQDPRGVGENSTLRKVTDLSFLLRRPMKSDPLTEIDFLCQAQVSVLITGPDPWRWVAYCFADTYFEHETRRDSAESYDDDMVFDEDDGSVLCQPDPFTLGEQDASRPILTPREYFVVVLESRLRHARDEWHVLVTKLRRMIDEYIETCPIMTADTTSPSADDPAAVRRSRDWAVKTKKLLRQLTQNLTATINQLESFKTDETFTTVTGPRSRYIPVILANIKQLGKFLQDLEFLGHDCDGYTAGLSFYLSHEGNRDAKAQARAANSGQMMAFVMLFIFTPIALAAAVLSMQEKAIPPPFRPNSSSFVILVLVFMVLVWSAIGALMNWERIRDGIKDLLQPELYNADIEHQEG
ncbi:hypothetical protein BGZ61DRAFT_559927 [Ilyonectria robusta]|uniref:uncharacterized protein n=1 Tax=Ilyonectria robusta TaxID=1079257 RepID=UPI001E8D5B9E|nr:uncharacterized protein BGZ61DRAFT_559927 [Ilyonectria robusta]KAH8734313.1 hypothetical protein BGZ61DRAFT_559927 [Ilyonectria robusta]